MLNEESEPLGFQVSLVKTKIKTFNGHLGLLLSCLYLFVVRMLMSHRDSLTLAVIFMPLLAVSKMSIDIWVGLGESWIHWIMGVALSAPLKDDESLSLYVLGASSLALWT